MELDNEDIIRKYLRDIRRCAEYISLGSAPRKSQDFIKRILIIYRLPYQRASGERKVLLITDVISEQWVQPVA